MVFKLSESLITGLSVSSKESKVYRPTFSEIVNIFMHEISLIKENLRIRD